MVAPVTDPELSVVVVVRGMARQGRSALESLSPGFQRGIAEADWETIAVEIDSSDVLGEQACREVSGNLRYFQLGADTAPGQALKYGVTQSRARTLGLMLDASHILTPRTLEHALRLRSAERFLAVVPEYVLVANQSDADLEVERELWQKLDWRNNPYQMFDAARFGPTNPNGFLSPLLGGSCMFVPRASFDALTRMDVAVEPLSALSLSLYTELGRLRETSLFVIPGEGAFRQLHPAVTRPEVREAEASMARQLEVFRGALGPTFTTAHREPCVLGAIAGPAQRFLVDSFGSLSFHLGLSRNNGEPPWYVDPA